MTSAKQRLWQRFWSKVDGGLVDQCWIWKASLNGVGYGRFAIPSSNYGYVLAHRWAYEQLRTEIPAGLVLDHLCRTRACVNPWHLEPVSRRVNALRGRMWEAEKTHCAQGHRYDKANTRRTKRGHRACRKCTTAGVQRWRARQLIAPTNSGAAVAPAAGLIAPTTKETPTP